MLGGGTCFFGMTPASDYGVDAAHSQDVLGCAERNFSLWSSG